MVIVEFYGVPRQRSGVEWVALDAKSLGDALKQLGDRFPALAADCFDGLELHPAFIANLNGERFVRDRSTPLADDDRLLLLSTDAGG